MHKQPYAPPSASATPREQAIQVVALFLESDAFPDRELERLDDRRGVTMEICYGVVRNLSVLRWALNSFTDRPPRPLTQACLFCGLYELLFMRSEPYAVLNETVESTRRIASEKEAHFVNAFLRHAQEGRDALLAELPHLPPWTRYSHPEPLWRRWSKHFGEDAARALCEWDNEPAFITITPFTDRVKTVRYLGMLTERRVDARIHPFHPDFILLPHGVHIPDLPGYHDGWFTVQDPATSLAVQLLNPQPGETILDACAAPGGKTLLMAQAMRQQGTLVAMDLYNDRLNTLRNNLRRAGCRLARVMQGDARSLTPETFRASAPQGFDAVLLDVPCSNTGVIRRRPDARWHFNRNRLAELNRTQRTILQSAARHVRPGGRLVYSTCSLEPEENLDMVNKWLASAPDFSLAGHRLLLPPETQTDGAFAALIQRR